MTLLRFAYLNLIRHKLVSLAFIFSLGMIICCLGLTFQFYKQSQKTLSEIPSTYNVVVGAKAGEMDILFNSLLQQGSYPDFLPYKLFESLEDQKTQGNLIEITPVVYVGELEGFRVAGTNSSLLRTLKLSPDEYQLKPNQVILGAGVAQALNARVGDSIAITPWVPQTTAHAQESFMVSQVLPPLPPPWDKLILMDVETAQHILKKHTPHLKNYSIWDNQVLHYFLIQIEPSYLQGFKDLINKRTVGQMIEVKEITRKLNLLTKTNRTLASLMAAAILGISFLCLAVVFSSRFANNRKTAFTLYALGYSKQEILRWLTLEAVFLSTLALAISSGMQYTILSLINKLTTDSLLEGLSGHWSLQAFIGVVSLFVCILAMILPMMRVFSKNVIQTNR